MAKRIVADFVQLDNGKRQKNKYKESAKFIEFCISSIIHNTSRLSLNILLCTGTSNLGDNL